MPARSPGGPGRPGATTLPLGTRRFTLEEYHRLGELGVLDEDDRVELLDGQVVAMTPIGPAHAGCVGALTAVLGRAIGPNALLWVQNPVRLGDQSEPQPDLAVLRARPDGYRIAHPQAHDILLVIEVADRSAGWDREVKLPLYARAGVPEVWLVNLPDQQVETYREPAGQRYTTVHFARRGELLAPLFLPSASVSVDQILG
jgi:Uma2 family endonuclease